MPQSDLTHIVLVLDRSSSMESLRGVAVEGVNNLLAQQRKLPGRATITLVQFSTESKTTWSNLPIAEAMMRPRDFEPDGWTALFDAVADTIDAVGARLADTPEEQRPAKVVFAILTDGEENSSRRHTGASVQERILRQTEVYKWEFLFLGASDTWAEQARELGIAAETAVHFEPSAEGLEMALSEIDLRVGEARMMEG